jgi:hypothetical protein
MGKKVWIIVLMLMVFPAILVFADEKPRYLQDAQKLYEKNKYIESIKILESNNETDGYKYYLILLNEQEIGIKAMKGIIKPDHENYKFIEYAKEHLDRFYYWEPSSHYYLRPDHINKLIEQVLKNSPDNKTLISKMLYKLAESYVMLSSENEEDMDEQEWDKIINVYKNAFEYAEGNEKEEIKKQIDKFEGLKIYYMSSGKE